MDVIDGEGRMRSLGLPLLKEVYLGSVFPHVFASTILDLSLLYLWLTAVMAGRRCFDHELRPRADCARPLRRRGFPAAPPRILLARHP